MENIDNLNGIKTTFQMNQIFQTQEQKQSINKVNDIIPKYQKTKSKIM